MGIRDGLEDLRSEYHTMKPTEQVAEAVLLLGPSGVGKSPLGALLEESGIAGRRCVHFDFGSQLRRLVAEDRPNQWVSRAELVFLREVLESGALLEEEHLPLAVRILQAFLLRQQVAQPALVVLNGFPRHPGQAVAIKPILKVITVVSLECDEETILRRIANDVGGDRADRTDDELSKVRARFRLFAERTAPLLDHYARDSVRLERIPVGAYMTPEGVYAEVREALVLGG